MDGRTAEERYQEYSREAVAQRREAHRRGWIEHYENLASTHYGMAEESRAKATESFQKTDREAVAVRRETNRMGWAAYWHRQAAMHYGMAEDCLAKAEKYEDMVVPNLPPTFPSRNGYGP